MNGCPVRKHGARRGLEHQTLKLRHSCALLSSLGMASARSISDKVLSPPTVPPCQLPALLPPCCPAAPGLPTAACCSTFILLPCHLPPCRRASMRGLALLAAALALLLAAGALHRRHAAAAAASEPTSLPDGPFRVVSASPHLRASALAESRALLPHIFADAPVSVLPAPRVTLPSVSRALPAACTACLAC